ncbi:MAG: hypothetical protein QXQ57_08645 [Sulfolobales archaeon]
MEEIARFGGIEHNIAIMLDALQSLERILADLYYRASHISPPNWKLLLRYIADLCAKHAEYVSLTYYEASLIEKMLSPAELKEITSESMRILGDVAEIYKKVRDSSELREILTAVESIEEMEKIVLEAHDILGKLEDTEDRFPIATLFKIISEECRVRRDILKELMRRSLDR